MNIASKIIKADKKSTVFTISDIQTLLNIPDKKTIYNALFYATEKGELYKLSEGIYSISKDYSRKEFANKYRKPSYISTYTVLQESGVVFQPYESIYAISNRSEKQEIDGQQYIYRQVKDEILLNQFGTKVIEGVHTASIERAICDKLYLDGMEYFDNLREVDWNYMTEMNTKVFDNSGTISLFIKKNKNESATDN